MHYDLIITGGGLSGLSLLFQLSQHEPFFSTQKILLIERAPKLGNDRTWSFWERGAGEFEAILAHSWGELVFKSPSFERVLTAKPYRYKMLRSADFYAFMQQLINKNKNISVRYDEILQVETHENQAVVHAKNGIYTAKICANSIPFYAFDAKVKQEVPDFIPPPSDNSYPENTKKLDLLQHFKGWIIRSEEANFDVNRAVLMDFTVPQEGDCRFVYVLPTDSKTALVEYTVFSDTLLAAEKYDTSIADYIRNNLNIKQFELLHEEFGVIPMSLADFPSHIGSCVVCIGTASGSTRSSTGYTFMNIQKESRALAAHLAAEKPISSYRSPAKQAKTARYDRVLFEVINKRKLTVADIFTAMFSRNSVQKIFQFLDGETTFLDDLKIMSTMPLTDFSAAALRSVL